MGSLSRKNLKSATYKIIHSGFERGVELMDNCFGFLCAPNTLLYFYRSKTDQGTL